MVFATFLAAFAIAAGGSPSSVTCNPDPLPVIGAYGYTWFQSRRIELAPNACAGLLLLSATPEDRAAIAGANPWLDPNGWMALGALALAHEAQHSAGVVSEGEAECRAVRVAPELLARYLSGSDLGKAVGQVQGFHQAMGPAYHSVC